MSTLTMHQHTIATLLSVVAAATTGLSAQNLIGNSNPNGFASQFLAPFGLFAANDQSVGMELWRMDSATLATSLVRNIAAGSEGSYPTEITAFPAGYVFVADDGVHGVELWRSNGTQAGTVLAADIHPTSSSYPRRLTTVGNLVFFIANDGVNGDELWSYDGTTAVLVRDIRVGPGDSAPMDLCAMGNTLLFAADDGTNGRELWISNGTTAGTQLVSDIRPGIAGSSPHGFAATGGLAIFVANDGTSGAEPWRTDGTAVGTFLVKDIEVGPKGSAPGTFLIHYRALFAATTTAAGRELWVSDLSAGGASLWTDLRPGAAGSEPTDLVATSFYDFHFIADDGLAGREIWQSTVNGAFLSRRTDVVAGSGSVQPRELVLCSSNGNLVFTDGTDTPQLWATDGSVAGASVIGSFQVGPADLTKNASGLGPAAVVFAAEDATTGLEPWRTNGTALGTARIADIAPQGIGTPYPDIEPHGGPLGSTIQICIRNGAPTGLGVFAFASMPAPPVSIPGLVDGPILLPLGSLLLITAALLDPAGSACMPIALPLTLTTIEFSTQAFSLDPASQLFRATDLAAIGITTTSTSSIFGGPSQCSGVFRDLDHRYEVDLTLPTPTTGSHPTGSFVFRHRTCTDLIEACLTDLKEHVYPYDGKATHLVFKGNTPLGKLKGLELWFYDDAGGKTFVWKSYC